VKRKELAARRERNQELGKLDAAHRCQFCKQALKQVAIVRYLDGAKFCDDECLDADEERARLVAK
jgi:hypothetical protein